MIFKPWDCVQPDEWLPQSLRLCWGSGSDSGGGGTTGGGDWGSSGSYDASGFDAGGIGAWGGSAYDASYMGSGAGGGGDWGSFGDTNYASFNAPNPTFEDVGGPNAGVTTGGGDWGSAGAFSAAGTGGGPAGAMFGAAQGAGAGLWGGGDTGGGGLFGDYGGGGGGGGYYGGQQGGGGSFGGFGSGTLGGSNAIAAAPTGPTGSAFADSYGGGSLAGPAGGSVSSGAPTTSEAQEESAGPSEGVDPGGEQYGTEAHAPGGIEPGAEQFGAPAQTEAAPSQDEAAPEVSTSIAGGRETNFDYGRQAETEAQPSVFGPESVTSQEGRQALSDLTQSALAPADVNWGSVFEAPSDPGYQNDRPDGPIGPIAEPGWFESLISDIPGVQTPAWAQDIGKSLTDVNTWLAPQNQGVINYLGNLYDQATQPNWGSVFEGAAGPSQAYQQGTQDLSNLTQSALAPQDVNWGSVFEGAAPDSGINPGAEQTGIVEASPGIEASISGGRETDFTGYESLPGGQISAFIPGGQTTDFEYAPAVTAQPAPEGQPSVDTTMESGQPGPQTTTDDATTKGSDPALSGLPAEATQGQPTAGQPGQPGVPPAANDRGVSPDAAVNAASVAMDQAGVTSNDTHAAVTAAVYDAARDAAMAGNPISPADLASVAYNAALTDPNTTQEQASAIANAVYNAAVSQTQFDVGTTPAQPTQAPAARGPELTTEATGTSAFIPGGQQTNFEYAPSTQAPPAQQPPGLVTMLPPQQVQPAEVPSAGINPGAEQYGVGHEHDDTPEPPDTSPPQDPNAPRPPGNIPGQLIGARDNYPNSQLDNPRNPFYRDSGRTDYPQGRPGVTYRTARQAGIEPNFHVGDYNVHDLDARLIDNINRAIVDMERAGIPNTLRVSSAYRPATRAEALERGMDPRTSQESVYARGNAPGGVHFAAARPGGSNHAPGRAIDFNPGLSGRALTWLRANARDYGLETLGFKNGKPFDVPHIQLQGARGNVGARPSAQEQAEQRAIDAQNRQANAERGQARTQQAMAPPGGWRGIGSDRSDIAWTAQPDVAPTNIPAALPPPTMPLPPEPASRPPAEIPAPAPFLSPPSRGRADPKWQAERAQSILKDATKGLNKDSGQAAFQAASVVAAKALAEAGIPLDMARDLMTKGAIAGAIANGYGPGGPNSTVMGFSIWGKVQSAIAEGVNAALQGYNPGATGPTPQGGRYGPGPVQGPQGFQPDALRALAKGGHVAKDEPVVVGEEGPETFVPDQSGTVVPHMPQPGKGKNVDRWPKMPAVNYPGRYGGVEREYERQTREAQNPMPSLIDLIDSGRLPLNAANWRAMLNDPSLIALGQSRMGTVDAPAPEPAAEPPDPTNPMAQALGYGSIRRPLRVGRQIY